MTFFEVNRDNIMPGRNAFSLLELIVVLTVAAVLMALAAPKIDLARYRVDASARQIEGVLQQAQRFAVQRQQDVIVSFDTTGGAMRMTFDANNNRTLDASERQSVTGLIEGTRFVAAPSGLGGGSVSAINGQNLTLIGGQPAIIFRRDGAASSNLEVYLGSTETPPTQLRALSIIQATGRAQLFRRAGTAWAREGI